MDRWPQYILREVPAAEFDLESKIEIHVSAHALLYDLEAQIAAEVMMFSLRSETATDC